MVSECARIADQLSRAFSGDPWHGSPVRELLHDMTAEQALARPLASAHTIWELVVHVDMYLNAGLDAIQGTPMPKWYETQGDWPPIVDRAEPAWTRTTHGLFSHAARLAQAIEFFTDARLQDPVPGRKYSFYHLFHGIVQHSLYHSGQIAMLRKALSR